MFAEAPVSAEFFRRKGQDVTARDAIASGVLVIDDDDLAREALVKLLNEEGYDARGVANGAQALRTLRNGYRPALLLLDMVMIEMDGWDFRMIQQRDPALAHIPVVVLTSVVNPALEAKKLHAVAGFRKPFDVCSLLEVVSEYCRRLG
jgi:CheY-like chemotaxis protein